MTPDDDDRTRHPQAEGFVVDAQRGARRDWGEGATRVVAALTFETPTGDKPVFVADWILRVYAHA
jgi:hypothetical protein